MKRTVLFAVLFFVFIFCSSNSDFNSSTNGNGQPAHGKNGMVSSAHPLATKAGIDILRKGGNAFDGAVGIATVLNVVEPMMSGIGGYGTIVVYDAEKGESRFLNCSSHIPKAVDSDGCTCRASQTIRGLPYIDHARG